MFDTIVAPLTPNIASAIGVVRISGKKALDIAKNITKMEVISPRYAHYTAFFDEKGGLIDRGLAIFFKAPYSFTGEDCVEFQCHGSLPIILKLLETICSLGARIAERGEFSKRAFLNDKMDLSVAEAMCDMINATDIATARANLHTMEGVYAEKVKDIRKKLESLRILCEANIDFADDIGEFDFNNFNIELRKVQILLEKLIENTDRGIALNKRKKIVLAGSPNAGKSSIFNRLMEDDLAIVSDIAGTTRDVLRSRWTLGGAEVDLLDTAGIREEGDLLEQEGIRRAKSQLEQAELILYIYDVSSDELEIDFKKNIGTTNKNVIMVANKIDLLATVSLPECIDGKKLEIIQVSAATGEGFDKLISRIKDIFESSGEVDFAARIRHKESLLRCKSILDSMQLISLDFVAEELRLAIKELDFIFGEYATEELLGEIFSKFCIGK